MLAGFMALQPLIRYGIIAGVIVTLVGSIWFHGYFEGRAQVKQAWDAAIAEQSAQSSRQVIAQNESTQDVMDKQAKAEQKVREKIQIVEREVIKYVQANDKPCELDPAAVRLFDELSRVPTDAERMPTPNGGAGESAESPDAGITTDEILQAYEAAVEKLSLLWVDYSALVQWERGRYIVEKTAFEGTD